MDKEEKYNELSNIVDTLDSLINDVSDDYYSNALEEIKFEAQRELEEVEEELQEEQDEELREMNREFERSRL